MTRRFPPLAILVALFAILFVGGDTFAGPRPIAFVPTGTGVVVIASGVEAAAAVSPGASGNLLTSNGTQWTSSSPPSSGGYTQLFDCDFSAQSTTSLNSYNTNATICGVAGWHTEPAIDAAVFGGGAAYGATGGTIDLTSGTGLVFVSSNVNTTYGNSSGVGGGRGGSLLWISLASIGVPSGFNWQSELRIWISVSAQTMASCTVAGRTGVFWGVDNDSFHGLNNAPTGQVQVALHGVRTCTTTTQPSTVADVLSNGTGVGWTNTAITGKSSWDSSIGTSVVWTGPIGRFGLREPFVMLQSAYSGGWADENNLIPWSTVSTSVTSGVGASATGIGHFNAGTLAAPFSGQQTLRSRYGIVLGHYNGNFTTSSTNATITRLRVDYKL